MANIDANGATIDKDGGRWRKHLSDFLTPHGAFDEAFFQKVLPSRLFLVCALAAVLCLKLVALYGAVPVADEGYYWLWGQYPDWSYFDHPPLGGWVLAASSTIFGDSLFAIRSTTIPVTLGIGWIIWFWVKELVDAKHRIDAFLTALLVFSATPLMLIYTSIVFHDYLLIGAGIAAVHFFALFVRFPHEQQRPYRYLYAACFFLGLAGLSKYSGVFIGLGFAVWVLTNRTARPLLASPHLWLAAGLSVAMQFPTLYWNMIHGWPSFQFNLQDRIGTSPDHNSLAGLWTFSSMFALSLSPIACAALVRFLAHNHSDGSLRAFQSLGRWIFLLSTVTFALLSLTTQVFHYWNMAAILCFVVIAFFFIRSAAEVRLHVIWCIAYTGSLLVGATMAPIGFDPARADENVYRISHGLPEIVAAVEAEEDRLGAELVLTTDYRIASLLALAAKRTDIMSIGHRTDMFDYWFDREAASGGDAIILAYNLHPMDEQLAEQFAHVAKIRDVSVERMGGVVQTYQLYHAQGFRGRPVN